MAIVINLYRDNLCESPIKQLQPGQAGIVGYWADPSRWSSVTTGLTQDDKQLYIYKAFINKDRNGNSVSAGCDFGITADGGGVLYNLQTTESSFSVLDEVIKEDTQNQSGGGSFNNALFAGVMTYDDDAKKTCYIRFTNGVYARSVYTEIGSYTQDPWTGQRQTWDYYNNQGYYNAKFCMTGTTEIGANSRFGYAKVYSLPFDGLDCYAFFIGIDFDGSINDTGNYITDIYIIPKAIFKDKIPRPYVGPVSKDSADASFIPTRAKYRDELLGYNIDSLDKDPLGLCSTNSTTRLVKMTKQAYMDLIDGIYSGDSTSVYGNIGQLAVNFFNQTGGRSAQDIQTMLSAIQTIHLVPSLNLTGQATNITIKALGGYALGKEVTVTPLAQQITERGEAGSISATITPEEASFLNYSPYTTATLVIPWVGNVRVDPSELYAVDANGNTVGGTIEMEYAFDALTGLLTIYTTSYVPGLVAKHLINLSQVNVAVELPISGIGTAGEKTGLRAITGAVTGLVGAITGNVPMAVSGVSKAVDASIDASKVSSVSNQGIGSISPYFSPTQAGLILTYPKPSNSANFAHDLGVKCNESGTVDSFKGYAEFINVDLSTVTATQGVKEQILAALERGVIIQ